MSESTEHDIVAPRPPRDAVGRRGHPSARVPRRAPRPRRPSDAPLPDPKLIVAVAAAVILVVALVTAGATHRSAPSGTDTHHTGSNTFSVRPLLCFATPYSGSRSTAPLLRRGDGTTCSTASALTASALAVTPRGTDAYTSRLAVIPLQDDASFPSMTDGPGGNLLLSGASGAGPERYVVGPAALSGTDVASTSVSGDRGMWEVTVHLTDEGSVTWDALASEQFHALVAVDLDSRVLTAPVIQPERTSFTSFDGRLQLCGFAHAEATATAAAIARSH